MADIILCPRCERKLRVPDSLQGQRVKCPTCGATLTAASAGAAPAMPPEQAESYRVQERRPSQPRRLDEDVEAESSRLREEPYEEGEEFADEIGPSGIRMREVAPWKKVRTGVTLILSAILVMIGAALLACGGFLFLGIAGAGAVGRAPPGPAGPAGIGPLAGGFLVVAAVALLAWLTSLGLTIAGNVFCLAVPPRRGAKTLAAVSLALVVGSLVMSIGGSIIDALGGAWANAPPMVPGRIRGVGGVISAAGALMAFVQIIVFLCFLRAVALAVQARALAQSIQYLMIVGASTLVMYIGMVVLVIAAGTGLAVFGPANPGAAGAAMGMGLLMMVCSCLVLVLALAFFIWYIVTLVQVRTALADYLGDQA